MKIRSSLSLRTTPTQRGRIFSRTIFCWICDGRPTLYKVGCYGYCAKHKEEAFAHRAACAKGLDAAFLKNIKLSKTKPLAQPLPKEK